MICQNLKQRKHISAQVADYALYRIMYYKEDDIIEVKINKE